MRTLAKVVGWDLLFPKSRSRSWHPPYPPSRPGHSSFQSWRWRRANVIAVANNCAGPPQIVQRFAAFSKNAAGPFSRPRDRPTAGEFSGEAVGCRLRISAYGKGRKHIT
jgi:hypothetical protein